MAKNNNDRQTLRLIYLFSDILTTLQNMIPNYLLIENDNARWKQNTLK